MKRFQTRVVQVGDVAIGGDNPIRIQSMTTTNTRDVIATAEQIMRLSDIGCEIARVTVQGKAEAYATEEIKNLLIQKGYTIPLVADVHFYPPAAMIAADFVDKVRINPGNYGDRRAIFQKIIYTDASYETELAAIEEKFTPLVLKCKERKIAMRIGTNHGSLSDRIMSRYGDTVFGMLESALEFARICRKLDYHNFVFSMKASNTKVMIAAYRLLVEEMKKLGWDYPLHLGVTEAGLGEDGRIKSSVGTGTLLLEGIGDTIRVSLTEDPESEIDPCKRLIALAKDYSNEMNRITLSREKKITHPLLHPDGTVAMYGKEGDEEVLLIDPLRSREDLLFIQDEKNWEAVKYEKISLIVLEVGKERVQTARRFFAFLEKNNLTTPVILAFSYDLSDEDLIIHASAEFGSLLIDGLGVGICIQANKPYSFLKRLSFNILQACRMRSSKTEFIACPGCGRTLYDLQEVTKQIQEKTGHLPGVKIAVMGCIVNGPGEMADADFGYVGSKPGKIDLYLGKTCVEKNIDAEIAVEKLVTLIKKEGKWVEPSLV